MKTRKKAFVFSTFTIGLLVAFTLVSCKKDTQKPDEHYHAPEEEVITSIVLTLTEVGSQTPGNLVFAFRDTDGPGGNAPVQFDTINLPAFTNWSCAISVLNESTNPITDLTEEIHHEGTEHLFCIEPAGADLTVSITDTDGALPLGLESSWVVGAAGSGSLTIKLKHQPGIKTGECAPGETDIEVTFSLVIE